MISRRLQIENDDGLSLIELIIVVVIVSVIGAATTMILANSLRTQDDVTTTTEATNSGQLFGQSIERAMRNAVDFDVIDSGRMLRVHTTLDGRTCQGFWITSAGSGDALYMTSGTSMLPGSSTTLWPKPWHPEGGVSPGSAGAYFTDAGDRVTFSIDIQTDAAPVTIEGTAVRRAPDTGGANPCW